jgi:hypothetical protein
MQAKSLRDVTIAKASPKWALVSCGRRETG